MGVKGKNLLSVHKDRIAASLHKDFVAHDADKPIFARYLKSTQVPNAVGYVVYGISDPLTGKVVYVGQTGDLRKRVRGHLRRGLQFARHPPIRRWLYDVMHSDRALEFIVLESCVDEACSLLAEAAWVEKLSSQGHPLLNNWKIHKAIIRENGINRR